MITDPLLSGSSSGVHMLRQKFAGSQVATLVSRSQTIATRAALSCLCTLFIAAARQD